jgi:hypothetical protein
MRIFYSLVALFGVVAVSSPSPAADTDFNGRWDITVHGNTECTVTCAWWLEVTGAGAAQPKGSFVGFPDGSLHDLPDLSIKDGVLRFAWDRPASPGRNGKNPTARQHIDYEVRYVNGKLEGSMSGAKNNYTFTGVRAPVIDEHDDGTWVKGKSIALFNGTDLTGWTGIRSPQAEGWTVVNGILTGAGQADDLVTKQKFWNFELHAEFRLGEHSNSGIGLRGRYEVQIASDYGQPPGMHGTGALYTRILPKVNAGKAPGEWQTYDIRLVGREVTAILNGVTLYEKGVIDGLTGIAYDANEGEPGSIELQGDHGAVEFRNIILKPLTKSAAATR